jgi:hypothetical protein
MQKTLILAAALATLQGCVYTVPTAPSAGTGNIASSTGLPRVDTAAAQRLLSPDEALQTVDFPVSGSKTLTGHINGYHSDAYAIPVRAGQTLKVNFQTASTSAYFNIHDAKDSSGAAVFAGEREGQSATLRVTADGTYVLRPYLVRAVARRGSQADYTFTIERQ